MTFNKILGKKVLFIQRVQRTDIPGYKNVEYEGIVLDRFRDFVTEDKKVYSVDFYLVELTKGKVKGLIHHFRPHEANRIIYEEVPEENQVTEFSGKEYEPKD